MKIEKNISLKPLITFSVDEKVEELITIHDEAELVEALDQVHSELHILGGGSNILPTETLKGITLLNRIKGIQIVDDKDEYVLVRFASGEVWHNCVMWAVERNLGGIENLALIPGTVGAAPIQNIGAYGVELKDVFYELEAIHLDTKEKRRFTNEDCCFGYRESVFKQAEKNKYFIFSVTLKLNKTPILKLDYGNIKEELKNMNVEDPTIHDVAEAVISIRRSKLPDPAVIGNAGSFFKNPVISMSDFQSLAEAYPAIPNYSAPDGKKIPAAWLIEQCEWKGKRFGDYGVHDKQALVLVNYGQATGRSILELSQKIIDSVVQRFGILLHREVNIW